MKIKAIIIFLLLSYISVSSYAQQKPVEVTYVGNAGFLIQIGDKKILVDALFKGFEGDYILPDQIQEKLNLAQAPFDDVDLVLVTHAHGDHINASMVEQHLRNNPKAIFASTKQTVDALNARDTVDNFHKRRIGFNPSKEKSDQKDIKGISVEAFYFPHGPDSRIINNGFLVTVNGISFLHTGDVDYDQFTYEEFQSFKLPERKIDLAFIQHFYLTNDSISQEFVNKGIGGKYILPIHYHFTTPSFDAEVVREYYPDAILFNKELESWKMPDEENNLTSLKGDYLGQTPPGDVPEVFAQGIISVDSTVEHGSPTFSPDGDEVFWQSNYRQDEKETKIIGLTMRSIEGHWTKPEVSLYNSQLAFSLDGKRLYFIPYGHEKMKGVHYVEKQGSNWGEPKKFDLADRFPEIQNTYCLSFTKKGTVYFFGHAEGLGSMNNFALYRSELVDGVYATPELLPPSINMGNGVLNWTPFVAPDESYLIFSSNRQGQQDLYISFRKTDSTWTEPKNLGEPFNTERGERFPTLSPDGKYLFFSRWFELGNEDVMWVSTDFINKMKKETLSEKN